VTDEVGQGPDAAHLREIDEGFMHRGHDLSLVGLKAVSEGKETSLVGTKKSGGASVPTE
jgi:hypothetical protein